jgi:hypothetical protein
LNSSLEKFKELLTNNEECAKELIKIIAEASNTEAAYRISNIIRNTFSDVEFVDEVNALLSTSGTLLTLILGNSSIYQQHNIRPVFHDIIQEKILSAFDIDLAGDQINTEI